MSKWLIAFTVMLPTLIEIIDTSIVNVSLSHIKGALSADYDETTWAITAYLVSNAIVIPMAGWFSRLLGRKNYLIGSIVVFTISSFLCGSAWDIQSLVFFRVIQGLGGGGLMPLSQAIVRETFPRGTQGQASATAIYGMGAMMGPLLGPLLGGWITENWAWRWVFYINIPIGIISAILVFFVITDPPYMQQQKMKIDYMGISFLAVGLGSLQYVLDKGQREDWFASESIVFFSFIAVAALALLIINERYSERPIVNLQLFKDMSFSCGVTIAFFVFLNMYGSIVLLPIFVQLLMGYTAYDAGLVLAPGGLATMLAMPLAGRLVTKFNPKLVLAIGLLISAFSTYAMAKFNLSADFNTFLLPRVTLGIGMGLTFIPLTLMTLSHIPRENMLEGTSLYNLFRNLGGSIGLALTRTALSWRSQFHQTRLAEHLTPYDSSFYQLRENTAVALQLQGLPADGAENVIYKELVRQSTTLAFNDAFLIIGIVTFCIIPLVLLMKKQKPPGVSGSASGQNKMS